MKPMITLAMLALLAAPAAQAQELAFSSGSDGSDGALAIAEGVTFNLNMTDHPDGIYQYTSVSIGQSATLRVIPNNNNSPLVMLVSGNFTMGPSAQILNFGNDANIQAAGMGGAGGFAGGMGGVDSGSNSLPGPGLGPGGGKASTEGGLSDGKGGSNAFMRPSLVPLVGGSGGGGGHATVGAGQTGGGGGGGGGALLIAVDGKFSMSPFSGTAIDCKGGNATNFGGDGRHGGSGGSGGAIRIIANVYEGGFFMTAGAGLGGPSAFGEDGANGEIGIIRVETFDFLRGSTFITGTFYRSLPGLVDADGSDLSTLRISQIGGVAVPADAGSNTALPDVIIPAGVTNPVQVQVAATNVTPGVPAVIRINIDGAGGSVIETTSTLLAGTPAASTATASVNLPSGKGTMAAVIRTAPFSAPGDSFDVASAASGKLGIKVDGELVEKIERITQPGDPRTRVEYVTASGKRASRWLE